MRDFFHGWRRKAGCVTLVMAIVATNIWVQGIIEPKSVKIQIGHRIHWLTTNTGRLTWVSADKVEGQSLLDEERQMTPPFDNTSVLQRERTMSFHLPILCLILLSAYLILWKPRKKGG